MSKRAFFYLGFFSVLSLCSCAKKSNTSLKTAYQNDFLIGTALAKNHILMEDKKADDLIIEQFNAITAENVMKSALIHPTWQKYNFDLPDKFVEYGQKNKMTVVGHTLIWHSQLSPFVQQMKNADSLKMFMREHINTVAGRYAGKIKCWDVVNEAIEEDGSYRKSVFYNLLGEDYIVQAFELAAKADPNAELYYNDYDIEKPAKRKGAIALIKKIQEKGVRIDGVGIQGHWSIDIDNIKDIEDAINEFSALGIKIAFTELDFSVLPNPWALQGADVNQRFKEDPKMNPYTKSLPDSIEQKLTKKYKDLFSLLLKNREKISRVTFWGVNDGHSWLNNWPIKNRTNYPLLFDRQYKAKKTYQEILDLKNSKQ